jgi:hypothetical protein
MMTAFTVVPMTPIHRRHFLKQAAGTAAALFAHSIVALTGTQRNLVAGEKGGTSLDAAGIGDLASKLSGQVITPAAAEYESARRVFNRAFDRHPALIVRCASGPDVARTLDFAQRHSLPVAVRGGGHNRAGFSVCDGGVVIDLSALNRVEVDVARRVARAQAGALTIHLDTATQRFGLATTSAGCPTVGIAGLTLGGGEGLLMSKYGAACDNLISAQLVTVDGRHIEAGRHSNEDLFWALRGGGGNFGVVTALDYQLHPVTDVLAGTLIYPTGRIPELLQAFAKFVAAAPDEMNVVGQVVASQKGSRFQMLVCHCGDPRRGNDLLEPLRALAPTEDNIRVQPYGVTNATVNPAAPAAHFQTNVVLPELSDAVISKIASATNDTPPNTRVFMVPLYGAITRVGLNDTAFPLRRPCCELDIMGRWNNPADRLRAVEWVNGLRNSLQPFAFGTYVNQLGETSDELVRAAYGPHYARLAAIKRKYDPTNALRLNQNIKPG